MPRLRKQLNYGKPIQCESTHERGRREYWTTGAESERDLC
ncbi:unnamed protein product [Rodentolepis nana]|uniref:Uncharacterized protein n=1 Tax=Rodentolepis nana TaxID=102285 RepID=A0A0R3TH04_RODNA|nr:unnamed protein product [Rodentolepis nana]